MARNPLARVQPGERIFSETKESVDYEAHWHTETVERR